MSRLIPAMGELIKKINMVSLADQQFDIEINAPTDNSGINEIHIQNDKIILALSEKQFCKIATCILLARKQLHQIKEVE